MMEKPNCPHCKAMATRENLDIDGWDQTVAEIEAAIIYKE